MTLSVCNGGLVRRFRICYHKTGFLETQEVSMSFQAIKKVRLIGLGSMGSFFAPKLYKTKDVDFALIADGERKERLRTKGVTINGEHFLFPVETPAEADAADLVIIAVKSMAMSSCAYSFSSSCVNRLWKFLEVLTE